MLCFRRFTPSTARNVTYAPRVNARSPTVIEAGIMTSQFEREAKGVFDLGHHGKGQLSRFPFQPRFG